MKPSATGWLAVRHGTISLLLLIVLWAGVAAIAQSRLLPGPIEVAATMGRETVDGQLMSDLAITLARASAGFLIALSLGSVVGVLLGRSNVLNDWVGPWVLVGLNTPALIIVVLCYIWMGLSDLALVVAVAASKIPNVVVTMREGARALDRDLDEMASIYRFPPRDRLRHVLLPQLAPYLLGTARSGLALVWKIVLVAELLGRSSGVGFRIQTYFQLFDITRVLAYTAAFMAVMIAAEALLFAPFDRRLARWRR